MTYDVSPLPAYPVETGVLLASLDDGTREWREELGTPPVEAIVWQPYPNGYSIGALLLHMADAETGWIEQFAGGKPGDPAEAKLLLSKETNQDAGIWPVPPSQPIEWYYELQDRIRNRAKSTLLELDNPSRVFEGRERSYTLRWILAHVVEHDSYHGGQAVMIHELWKRLRVRDPI